MTETLKNRRDFLAAARAPRVARPAFVVQCRNRGDDGPMRVGYTCSKKVGNAVARNHAKRRLRAAAHQVLPVHGRRGCDYVLIGRRGTTSEIAFSDLCTSLKDAISTLSQPK